VGRTAASVDRESDERTVRSLPAELFWRVLFALLPILQQRWEERKRPLTPELTWARARYTAVNAADGSTLDALLRKTGLLKEEDTTPLAGRMLALLDLCSHLPRRIWYEADAEAHDQRFWPQVLTALQAGSLLIFDLGFTNFKVFAQLTQAQVTFITRAKSNLSYTVERTLLRSAAVHDEVVWIGGREQGQLVRLVQVLYQGKWYRYPQQRTGCRATPRTLSGRTLLAALADRRCLQHHQTAPWPGLLLVRCAKRS
jgi:hypothetical protein